jgi:hypothetical protein
VQRRPAKVLTAVELGRGGDGEGRGERVVHSIARSSRTWKGKKGIKNASQRLIPRLEESNITGGNDERIWVGALELEVTRSDRSIKRKEKESKNEEGEGEGGAAEEVQCAVCSVSECLTAQCARPLRLERSKH